MIGSEPLPGVIGLPPRGAASAARLDSLSAASDSAMGASFACGATAGSGKSKAASFAYSTKFRFRTFGGVWSLVR